MTTSTELCWTQEEIDEVYGWTVSADGGYLTDIYKPEGQVCGAAPYGCGVWDAAREEWCYWLETNLDPGSYSMTMTAWHRTEEGVGVPSEPSDPLIRELPEPSLVLGLMVGCIALALLSSRRRSRAAPQGSPE